MTIFWPGSLTQHFCESSVTLLMVVNVQNTSMPAILITFKDLYIQKLFLHFKMSNFVERNIFELYLLIFFLTSSMISLVDASFATPS